MDIRLAFNPAREELGYFDVLMDGADLDTGHELETAVMLSLFSNRRADADDKLPELFADRQGWWGDEFSNKDDDRIGSRYWLLAAEKQTNETRLKFLEYTAEALQWLVDDSIASEIRIQAEYIRTHVLGLVIQIVHGDGQNSRFQFLWDQLAAQPLQGDEEIRPTRTYLVTENGSQLLTEDGQNLIT